MEMAPEHKCKKKKKRKRVSVDLAMAWLGKDLISIVLNPQMVLALEIIIVLTLQMIAVAEGQIVPPEYFH